MKVGDLVMFNNIESKYAKWFYGQFGIVKACGYPDSDGDDDQLKGPQYCRIVWLQPVRYFGRTATYSDFSVSEFEVCNESR